jgi:hypothetical protein
MTWFSREIQLFEAGDSDEIGRLIRPLEWLSAYARAGVETRDHVNYQKRWMNDSGDG